MSQRKPSRSKASAPASDPVLGSLTGSDFDTQLGSAVPQSHQRDNAAQGEPPAGMEMLALPRSSVVVLRKSGGLHFTSREVTVFRDGRVGYRRVETNPKARRRTVQRLSPVQLDDVKRLVANADLTPRLGATHSPDTYAYELVARIARTAKATEVFDGAIPPSLKPLIEALQGFMPIED